MAGFVPVVWADGPRAQLATAGEEAVSGAHRNVWAGTPSDKRGRTNPAPEGVGGSHRSWKAMVGA